MNKFAGKTLLVLGSNVASSDIVQYAKSEGAYTIVADYLPPEKSKAKQYADMALQISTADIESLNDAVKKYNINGVLAGISEFNLLKAMELCRINNFPFYCTPEQWNNIESKDCFRRLCQENNVPCPETYFTGTQIDNETFKNFKYPLVLKPVDASASAGVFICHSEQEFKSHINESLEKSNKKLIIAEEFIKGNEFTAHYVLCNGKASLACVDNRYPIAIHDGQVTTIPAARIYPSVFIDDYIRSTDSSVRKMCESIGMKNGIVFVQGIHDPQTNDFRIFEAGLRCAGEAPYRFLSKITGQKFINILVDHALLGCTDYDLSLEKPLLDGKCCGIVSFVAKHGIVCEIKGLEETVKNVPSVVEYENRYPKGSEVPDTDTLRQLMIRFVMVCESREKMAEDIEKLNNGITVLNEKGENMIVKFSPEKLFEKL